MNAADVQDAIPETESPDAIPATESQDAILEATDHQLQLTGQQVRRMINYIIIC